MKCQVSFCHSDTMQDFDDYYLENGFLETFYEWCDDNGIDIEFDESGG